jgi:hypothetical protein
MAYDTFLVTHHNDGRKTKGTTTLGYLRYTLDAYQAVF